MPNGRITNADLSRQITSLEKYVRECNTRNEKEIKENREQAKDNAIAISGMKGASSVIALIVTAAMNLFITLFIKGIHQ